MPELVQRLPAACRRLMAYLLDADVFIRAKNLHYGLDFCPAFWVKCMTPYEMLRRERARFILGG